MTLALVLKMYHKALCTISRVDPPMCNRLISMHVLVCTMEGTARQWSIQDLIPQIVPYFDEILTILLLFALKLYNMAYV